MTESGTIATEEQIREQVLAVVLDLAPNSGGAHGLDAHLVEDLGYHSLALLELAFALEDEFDLEPIDEETARKITTVRLVQDIVIKRIRERDAA
jgi:acyl carrier protein